MASPHFKKILLDKGNQCEACSVFDVDNNGVDDIVCGEYWYEGPDFQKKHKICDIVSKDGFVWDFSDFPMDVNGDGCVDIITASWGGRGLYWRENPGPAGGEWITHKIFDLTPVETVRYFDIDGDGIPEIFPNCPQEPVCYVKLIVDDSGKGTGTFQKFTIGREKAGHGIGFGDLDGDGKPEILVRGGILHMPKSGCCTDLWDYSQEFAVTANLSVPMLVHDVNGDGIPDVIYGAAHGYGLFWLEQKRNDQGGRTWEKHTIDGAWSQYHDMQMIDLNGDGEPELLTGKRYLAHNGHDSGDADDVFVCYYTFCEGKVYRHIIDCGQAENGHSGLGIYFWTSDLTGNGKPDIVAPGKEGLYLFIQE